ncbi:MAG: DNA recombination protein RmuC [Desulfobacterales bacterium]
MNQPFPDGRWISCCADVNPMTLFPYFSISYVFAFCIGAFSGAVLCWLAVRYGYGIQAERLNLENENRIAVLSEHLKARSSERDEARDRLEQARRDLKSADDRILALSEERSAALSRLEYMAVLEKNLEKSQEQILALQDKVAGLQQHAAQLQTVIEKERASADEKISLLEDLKSNLTDTYNAISANALKKNNQAFLDLAQTTFSKYLESAKTDFELRTQAVKDVVVPVKEALYKYDEFVRAVERQRENAYGGLKEQVFSLVKSQNELQKETGRLVKALRVPHVRGRWGEITLQRVAELAGMKNRCDFFEQPVASGRDGGVRPDMIITLPGNRLIVVDSKVPLSAYLDSLEAESEEKREECLAVHARHVHTHILQLSQKTYWAQFQPTPEFVILFIPGENFFSAALSRNAALIEFGAERGVIPATPTTLITLLKTVSFAWRQETVAENAKTISELGKDLYERLNIMAKHLHRLGRNIESCTATYNRAVGSFERRVLTAARKFEELGVTLKNDDALQGMDPVEATARSLDYQVED